MKTGATLPKSSRLRVRREFERVGRQGAKIMGRKLIIEALTVSDSRLKLGITVTRKFGKAHDRNRFKRCVREAFRLSYDRLPKGLLLNIRPRYKDFYPNTAQIQEELLHLLRP